MTRFNNFPQAEAFNPLGILLAHHLSQLDEVQRTGGEGTENNNLGDDQLRLGVADAILAVGIARETLQPESADDGERGGENGGAGEGAAPRNPRPTDPTPPPGDVSVNTARVGFTPLVFLTESFLDEEPSGNLESQSSATNTVAEDQAEVGTSTLPNRSPEGIIIASSASPGWLTYCQLIHRCELECHNQRIPQGTWICPEMRPRRRLLHQSIMTHTLLLRQMGEEE